MNDKRVFRFKSHKGATISIHEKSERKSGRKKRRQKELDDFMVAARKTVGKNLSTDPSPEKNDTEEGWGGAGRIEGSRGRDSTATPPQQAVLTKLIAEGV